MSMYAQLGEMSEVLAIFGASILLGLVYGVVAVFLLTSRSGRVSLPNLMRIVALATPLCLLVAIKPSIWQSTLDLCVTATALMTVADFAASCLVDPWRAARRFTGRLGRLKPWLAPAYVLAYAGAVTITANRYDIPWNSLLIRSVAFKLAAVLLVTTSLDLVARAAMIGLTRWRRGTSATVDDH